MKKLVFASAMALASMTLVSTPALRAQDASQITIQDPAEFNFVSERHHPDRPWPEGRGARGFSSSLSAERCEEGRSRSTD
jgi:hypothetical protein